MARLVGDFLEAFSMPIQMTGGCVGSGERLPTKVPAAVLRSLKRTENTRMQPQSQSPPLDRWTVTFTEETLESSARFPNAGLFETILPLRPASTSPKFLRSFLKLQIKQELREFQNIS